MYSATCAAAVGALLCLSVYAHAADHPESCREDAKRLCAGVKPGEGRVAACLKQHESEVSGACKERLAHQGARQQ